MAAELLQIVEELPVPSSRMPRYGGIIPTPGVEEVSLPDYRRLSDENDDR